MKKNYLFLGFSIPDHEMQSCFQEDKFPGIQTHKFNWNFIKAIESSNQAEFTYVATRPISDFPYCKKKIIKGKKWDVTCLGKKINIYEIPFINKGVLKLVSRFLTGLFYSIKLYSLKKNKGGIIVYSVHIPFMMIGYILSKIFRVEFIGIWTDPPAISHSRESLLKSKLRNIELFISKILMNKTSRVIVLTKYLAIDFAPTKPFLVIEGIVDEREVNSDLNITNYYSSKTTSDKEKLKFIYTGSLEKRYGISNIVDAFTQLEETELIIYGRGDFEDELNKISKKYKNIIYKGFVSSEEILKIQREADFLINARSSKENFVKYSFPSKTLEYMLSGTPLISTMLPGIPQEYEEFIIVLEDNNPETIFKKINEVIKLSIDDRKLLGIQAANFACERNYVNQGKKITNFLLS